MSCNAITTLNDLGESNINIMSNLKHSKMKYLQVSSLRIIGKHRFLTLGKLN